MLREERNESLKMWPEQRGCVCARLKTVLEVAEKQVNSGFFFFTLTRIADSTERVMKRAQLKVKDKQVFVGSHFSTVGSRLQHLFTNSSTHHVDMIAQSHP